MKQTYTFLHLILIISLIFSCSPKETFYLAKGTGSFVPYKQKHSVLLEKPLITSNSEYRGGVTKTVSDSILFLASVEAKQNAFSLPALKKELPVTQKPAESRIAIRS
jgi:hypothetical protein